MLIPNTRRRIVAVLAAFLVAGLAAATVYRVLAPAEVITVARGGQPPVVDVPVGPIGRFATAPLIVDGRLRVYATTRQVWADEPVDAAERRTPYWSYRRWPAQLSGVVATNTTVVSRWSDGRLVALDAYTGDVTWRADGPVPEQGYEGRRTGAATVWAPVGLHTATADDGRSLVVSVGSGQVQVTESTTGRRVWRAEFDPDCRTVIATTVAGRLAAVDRCAAVPAVEFQDLASGMVAERWRPVGSSDQWTLTPAGCDAARSDCRALLVTDATGDTPGDVAGRGWLLGTGAPLAAPGLDGVDTTLAGDVAVAVQGGTVTGRAPRTGQQVWRRTDLGTGVRLVASEPDRVHLLTPAKDLVTLDPTSGAELSRFRMTVRRDGLGWAPGLAYAADGYVALERLRRPVDPDAPDQRYYDAAEPVVLAGTG